MSIITAQFSPMWPAIKEKKNGDQRLNIFFFLFGKRYHKSTCFFFFASK